MPIPVVRYRRLSAMLHLDVLIPVAFIAGLLLVILILWLALRRRITETQEEQQRQSDQLEVLENKMARIEGALFYGPSAKWTMENVRQQGPNDPEVRKRL